MKPLAEQAEDQVAALVRLSSHPEPFPRGFSAEPERSNDLHPALQWGPIAAELFDAITTQQALARNPNAREGNPMVEPFVHNLPLFYASKAAMGAVAGLLAGEIAKRGHPDIAKAVAAVNIALPVGAGAWNLTKMRP